MKNTGPCFTSGEFLTDLANKFGPERARQMAADAKNSYDLEFANMDKLYQGGIDDKLLMAKAVEKMAQDIQKKTDIRISRQKKNAIGQNAMPQDNVNFFAKLAKIYDPKYVGETVDGKSSAIYKAHTNGLNQIASLFQNEMLGFKENTKRAFDVIKGLYGEAMESPEAKQIVKIWNEMADKSFARASDSVGGIFHNVNWRLPQKWSANLLEKAWKLHPRAAELVTAQEKLDAAREVFIDHFVKYADYQAYSNRMGFLVDEAFLRGDYLSKAFDHIRNGSESDPNGGNPNSLANLISGGRKLFIKDAAGWMDLNEKFGEHSIVELMQGQIKRHSTLTALAEAYGPNAIETIEAKAKQNVDAVNKSTQAVSSEQKRYAGLINYAVKNLTGAYDLDNYPESSPANFVAGMRNLNVLKLGKALITSFNDNATAKAILHINGASGFDYMFERIRSIADRQAYKDALEQADLMSLTVSHHIYRSARDVMSRGWTGAYAAAQMKISFLEQMTQARKQAFRAVMLKTITKKLNAFASIDEITGADGKVLKSYGLNNRDWQILKETKRSDWFGHEVIRPRDILEHTGSLQAERQAAMDKLLAFLTMEDKLAVVEPTLAVQAGIDYATRGGLHRRDLGGELGKAVMQFKGFPINYFVNHFERSKVYEGGNRIAYITYAAAMMTIYGGAALQGQQLLAGKDPMDMTDPRFAGKAFLKGGALGLYGDFLFSTQSYGKGFLESLSGPVLGDLYQPVSIAHKFFLKSFDQDVGDAAADAGGDLVRLAKPYFPGAALWYTSAALDRALFSHLMNMSSPGYTDRMEQRLKNSTGQSMWWNSSGEIRAPNFEAAIGQ